MPKHLPAARKLDIVIPDCCNMGVVLRALVLVNLAVAAATIAQTDSWRAAVQRFVEASVLVELATMVSLLALCGARRIVQTIPAWGQRLACALVPAACTSIIVRFLAAGELTDLTPFEGMLIAGLFGIVLQHYLELRTLAFSPALTEARLQALQARIRPHFLYNSLNAVLSLIRTEPRRAEETLEDLADLFRVLMRDARDITSLEDEIRICRQYLAIESIRLGERLQVKWEFTDVGDEVLRRARMPALLLQPLLENAVHYGVEPARAPALVQIHVARGIDRIEIAVVNPVHPETDAGRHGNQMALDNIRERLALLYDVEGQLTTTEARGMFEVRLRFPYMKGDA